jgi:hypothetical protein
VVAVAVPLSLDKPNPAAATTLIRVRARRESRLIAATGLSKPLTGGIAWLRSCLSALPSAVDMEIFNSRAARMVGLWQFNVGMPAANAGIPSNLVTVSAREEFLRCAFEKPASLIAIVLAGFFIGGCSRHQIPTLKK